MDRRCFYVIAKAGILLSMVVWACGCSTTKGQEARFIAVKDEAATGKVTAFKPPEQNVVREIMPDVLVFRDLRQIDLNGDGHKEIIAVYTTKTNLSGVRAIRDNNGKEEIIFEKIFDSPDIKLVVRNGTPVIVCEATDPLGRRLRRAYCWNGSGFVIAQN
jgi:hypothetical protein